MRPTTLDAIAVDQARSLAEALLAGLPQRWLHDVGYAIPLRDTGFHSLDGARYLDRIGWPRRLCALVAHHSGAHFFAGAVGVGAQLAAFADERSAVSDALIFANQTTGVRGERMTVPKRLAEVLRWHGPDSAHGLAHVQRAPYLLDAAERVQARLARTVSGQVHAFA
jgi:hypothetical protein